MTAKLTLDQFGFLCRHQVPLSRVFNADGLCTKEWREIMSAHKLWVAFGVSPCQSEGHELRTRAGHCVQCRPERLTFIRRRDENGQVYVAYSRRLRRVKVGCAADCGRRADTLNYDEYGGACDWQVKWYADCQYAGEVEYLVQQQLAHYRSPTLFWRQSTDCLVEAHELYQCTIKQAHEALNRVLEAINAGDAA